MKKPLIIAAFVFAIVVGFLVWWFSDTQVIKRQTIKLTEVFTIKADDGKAARISKNQALGELVDREFSCTIDLENYNGSHSKDQLLEAHLYLGQACESSAVRVGEIEILSITDSRAEVKADFSISVRLTSGNSYTESAPATLIWAKSETENWKLREVILKAP
ncbi:MAG: hypothetical protein AB8F34_11660 [Akkermansiaceae bacterium]